MSAEQLALHIYGEDGNPTTIRAEIHRLRSRLGGVVQTKPYRLCAELDVDLHTVRAEWDELLVALRHAVLARGEIGPLWSFSQAEYGRDDLEVFERLVGLLPPSDPRHSIAAAHCQRLRA